jgi:hypothetical protein
MFPRDWVQSSVGREGRAYEETCQTVRKYLQSTYLDKGLYPKHK